MTESHSSEVQLLKNLHFVFVIMSDPDVTAAFASQSQARKALGGFGQGFRWGGRAGVQSLVQRRVGRGSGVSHKASYGLKVRNIYRVGVSHYCRLFSESTSLQGQMRTKYR